MLKRVRYLEHSTLKGLEDLVNQAIKETREDEAVSVTHPDYMKARIMYIVDLAYWDKADNPNEDEPWRNK